MHKSYDKSLPFCLGYPTFKKKLTFGKYSNKKLLMIPVLMEKRYEPRKRYYLCGVVRNRKYVYATTGSPIPINRINDVFYRGGDNIGELEKSGRYRYYQHRSIQEIYNLLHTTDNKVTAKDVIKSLVGYDYTYCHDAKKRMWAPDKPPVGYFGLLPGVRDEWGLTMNEWRKLIKLLKK